MNINEIESDEELYEVVKDAVARYCMIMIPLSMIVILVTKYVVGSSESADVVIRIVVLVVDFARSAAVAVLVVAAVVALGVYLHSMLVRAH